MSTFKLSDSSDFQKYKNVSKTMKNRRNKKRRRERKKEWKANNPKPERRIIENHDSRDAETVESIGVNDILKNISAKRKAVKR